MSNLDDKSKSSFKVVDKRRFNSEGELKSQSEPENRDTIKEKRDQKVISKEEPSKKNETSDISFYKTFNFLTNTDPWCQHFESIQ